MSASRALTALYFACGASAALAAQPTATAVEYVGKDGQGKTYFFMTSYPAEIAALDNGSVAGWTRTGTSYSVFANSTDDVGLVPVCRFYNGMEGPYGMHFYSSSPTECASVQATLPAWRYEGIAFYAKPIQTDGSCPASSTNVYRSYGGGYPQSESWRYTVDLTVQENMPALGYVPEMTVMCAPLSTAQIQADADRLLQQTTFGPTDAMVAHVVAIGPSAFINEQIAATPTQYPLYPYVVANDPTCVNNTTLPITPTSMCARDNYSLYQMQRQFFVNAINNPDQLRQRVAFALSQILVTSGVENRLNYSMRNYQQLFLDNAFGNFQDILTGVTLSPQMGDYLNTVNNVKGNPATGSLPNENYARELLQLFSIGLWELNQDGTYLTDAQGNPIPTYDQGTILSFARVFTGWTFPTLPGQTARTANPPYYTGQMLGVAANHDTGDKILLKGTDDAASKTMSNDLAFAISNVFSHPNVGPFISKQLIQKLVTGNPTPQYVGRIAAIFNNNGQGVRGDLKAVVTAILLDPEARGAAKFDPGYGKLREPALYDTIIARATATQTDGDYFIAQSAAQGENVLYPPTVFNYYSPDYIVPGTTLTGPEFQIQDTATALSRVNFAYSVLFGTINPNSLLYGATGTTLNWTSLQALAGNPAALVSELNNLLMNGTMSSAMQTSIITAVNAVVATDTLNRARTAVYLVASSPQFQVER